MARKKKKNPFKNIKKGALHRQLSIKQDKDIPVSLLRKIKATPKGKKITNPTKTGKRRIAVTELLKKRVQFALNFRR